MHMTYADIEVMVERERWMDHASKLPMAGFLIGSGLSLVLWSAIGLGAYILFA
jgi:hypothetical protein